VPLWDLTSANALARKSGHISTLVEEFTIQAKGCRATAIKAQIGTFKRFFAVLLLGLNDALIA
jgi:hypothetical protein